MKIKPKTLNEAEAAAMIGIAPGTLNRWRREGKIPSWRQAGRLIKYTPEDVDRAIQSLQKTGDQIVDVRQIDRKVLSARFGS